MKIGNYKLYSIETGRFALDGGAMFGVVPKNLWNRTNPADEKNRIELAMRLLLLKSDDRLILIDTGIGDKMDEKMTSIYSINHSKSALDKSLEKLEISPYQITDVILSHLHFDHAGGTTYQKNGKIELTFPNATHHVQKEQWNWALSPSDKDRASFIKENFLQIERQNKLNLLNGNYELLPGVECLIMYGHTPGMQLVKIYNGSRTLLYCSDLIPTASHIPIPWIMAYDNNPLITLDEKNKLLPKIVDEEWILYFEHDPFRKAGTVKFSDKGFELKEEISIDAKIDL